MLCDSLATTSSRVGHLAARIYGSTHILLPFLRVFFTPQDRFQNRRRMTRDPMPQTPKCRRTQNARALALHLLPGHSRYCRGIPVVGLDDQIRNSRRAAGVANHDAGMANHETLRVAHKERDRSLSIARGPLRAWRASAPARRRGTRAEYERECVNVTSVCGTTCERGGASLGATARVGKSQVAALLLRDSKPTRMLSKPTRILSGSCWQGSPPMPPVHLRLARAPGAASAGGDDGRAPLDRCALKVRQARPHISTRRRRARSAG